ncbi:MAG: HDOD domain-containing protein [Pseudomonadota bacterium]
MAENPVECAGAASQVDLLVQSLPPLPATASDLMRLLADENTPTGRLVDLVERDVALASRLVGLANSSFYALPEPVLNVRDAVVRVLGLDVTRGVIMSAIVGATLDYRGCRGFQIERFWRESLLVASLSRSLCLSSSGTLGDHAGTGYLCGLLLRIGLLGLAAVRPDDLSAVLAEESERPLAARLGAQLGTDHKRVGAAIVRHWQLPEPLPVVVECSLTPGTDSLEAMLTSVVTLATDMARHEIEISSHALSESPSAADAASGEFSAAITEVQHETGRLHQQAQTIAATL